MRDGLIFLNRQKGDHNMGEKNDVVRCKHGIQGKDRKLYSFLNLCKRRGLWSIKGMQSLICTCEYCGVIICPKTWCMIIIGAVDIILYTSMYYFIAFMITFRLFGDSLVIYAIASAVLHIVMYGLIQRTVKSALILALPWAPLQDQRSDIEQTKCLYSSYVRGRQIGMCLNIAVLVCLLIW